MDLTDHHERAKFAQKYPNIVFLSKENSEESDHRCFFTCMYCRLHSPDLDINECSPWDLRKFEYYCNRECAESNGKYFITCNGEKCNGRTYWCDLDIQPLGCTNCYPKDSVAGTTTKSAIKHDNSEDTSDPNIDDMESFDFDSDPSKRNGLE
ncbi:hypothetical protein COU54_01460 [Candidatus Pacearchaeota archaeon CG10_big_fil_rev_8_21_14_0_10_31_24]|nr:MAG: hypothetical protein COU54_01460 [Candidatus Pacearchaeota archaeon CG10_big_fil_rev_8_21_14_0_10_31_24]